MKKYILICVSAILMSPIFSSCEYLEKEPDDMLTLDGVFTNAENTEQWLAGLYSLIPDPLWGFLSYDYGYYMMSDEVQMASSLGQFGWGNLMNVQQGDWNPTKLVPNTDLWKLTYQKIRSALIFIENVRPIPEQRLTEDLVERYKNEARFLMAYYYTRMLEVYGPFPLITTLTDVTASTEELQKPRTPYDDIVDYLDEVLLDLSKVLPSTYDDVNTGRPTSGMCLSVRARMLLFAASPLFNGNPDYKDVKNLDGTPLFSQTYDESKWKRAADATKLVIDLPQYQLYKEYNDDGSIDAVMSCMNVHLTDTRNNPEIIFPYPAMTNSLYEYHLLPRGSGWAGCIGFTQNVIDAFFMKNGCSIDEVGANYSENGYSTSDVFYNTKYNYADANRTEGLVTRAGTYNMYVNREPRFYAYVRYNGQYCSFDDNNRDLNFMTGGEDGPSSHDSPLCGYQINKAINPTNRNGVAYPYKPGILIRLAEMYLNYAEALNEYDPGNADIETYINLVRERAGIPNLKEGLDQEQMREAIRKERRVEFVLEGGMRYMDIRRWKIAEEVFETPISGMNVSATTKDEFFKRVEVQKRVFTKKMYLWPIYQDYLDNNENLVQNKYW